MGKLLIGDPPPGTNSTVFAHVWSGRAIQQHIATLNHRGYHLPRNGLLIYDDNQFENPLELRLYVIECPRCKSDTKVDLLRREVSVCGENGCQAITSETQVSMLHVLRCIFNLVAVGLDCHYSQQHGAHHHEVAVVGVHAGFDSSDDSDIDVVN